MSLDSLKKRMRTVGSISKITNAMKLMASGKLQKQKSVYLKIKDYYQEYYQFIGKLISMSPNLNSDAQKTLHIVITSQLGLCGGYNTNIVKQSIKEFKPTDMLLQVGRRSKESLEHHFKQEQIIHYDLIDVNNFNYDDCYFLSQYIIKLLNDKKIDSIKIHFTKFINAINFEPTSLSLIPFDKKIVEQTENKINPESFSFEPSKEKIIESIIPSYLSSVIYGAMVESTISENASRRNAMDTATDNSSELINNLRIKYNRQRQAKITEEITEIISGSNVKE